MEVQCLIPSLGATNTRNITAWDAQLISYLKPHEKQEIKEIIDQMGLLSAKAQCLRVPITSFNRMTYGEHHLYLYTDNSFEKVGSIVVKGMLKVGKKNLFIRRQDGNIREISPLCVLDFYVHHTCQRTGFGRLIFDVMLSQEEKCAHQLGYDKPSAKLLSFLAKHYSLSKYVPQANQFVVFDAYFDNSLNSLESSKKYNRGCVIPLSFLKTTCGKDNVLELPRRVSRETTVIDAQGVAKEVSITQKKVSCKEVKQPSSSSLPCSSSLCKEAQQPAQRAWSSVTSVVRKDDQGYLLKNDEGDNDSSPDFLSKLVAKWADMPRSRYHAQLSGKGVAAALRPADSLLK